jgi:hypothetical protein
MSESVGTEGPEMICFLHGERGNGKKRLQMTSQNEKKKDIEMKGNGPRRYWYVATKLHGAI